MYLLSPSNILISQSSQQSCEVVRINVPIWQVGKMKLNDLLKVTAIKWNSPDINPGGPTPESQFLKDNFLREAIHPCERIPKRGEMVLPGRMLKNYLQYHLTDIIWFLTQSYKTCFFNIPNWLITLCWGTTRTEILLPGGLMGWIVSRGLFQPEGFVIEVLYQADSLFHQKWRKCIY